MIKRMSVLLLVGFLVSCAHKKQAEYDFSTGSQNKDTAVKKNEKGMAEPTAKAGGIVVDNKDLQTLDKMTKAVEAYVIRNEKKSFLSLCKDTRFDCFVDDVVYPKGKKKMPRPVPPYSSGSKMGLHGEKRVQVKYDFYP